MKNLAKLNGAKALNKKEQKNVFGGIKPPTPCRENSDCISGCCGGPIGCVVSNEHACR